VRPISLTHDDVRTCIAQRVRPLLCVLEEERLLRTSDNVERPIMRTMYDEVVPGKSSLQDVESKFLANWNKSVFFHSDDQFGLCTGDCSFAFIYTVPKVFGEGQMELDFDANKTVVRKRSTTSRSYGRASTTPAESL
jgi:hypothetical protein